MTVNRRFGIRFAVLACLLGAISFYAGARLVTARRLLYHPQTGRQIAGIATNASWMDRASREQEEAPDLALSLIGVHAGMTVADVGAGSGYMTMRLARLVEPGGRVWATDIQPALLQIIHDKAAAAGLSNIQIVRGTEVDAGLPADAIDLALLVDVYHEMAHPREMLRSIRRSLKVGGRLTLIEYRLEDPRIPIADTHRMSVAGVRTEVEADGFVFERLISELPRQHIIVFHKE